MDILSVLVDSIVASIGSKVTDRIFNGLEKEDHLGNASFDLEKILSTHIIFTYNWSNNIQIFGMPHARETLQITQGLKIGDVPRKFSASMKRKILSEDELISTDKNYVILGDPGSGKTTTIRRLIARFFQDENLRTQFEYPILVRLRHCELKEDLYYEIAAMLNFPISTLETRGKSQGIDIQKSYVVGSTPIKKFVTNFLDQTSAILFIDGLDEIAKTKKHQVENALEELALSSAKTKIIVSCRSGDYNRNILGFDIIEMQRLGVSEIKKITKSWLGLKKSNEFIESIKTHPSMILADRPLFLTHLILLYQENEYIPENGAEIYRRVVLLMLEKWDRQRGISRKSMYHGFTPERKLDFLATLSFELTFIENLFVFDTYDLNTIYNRIRTGFGLPVSQSDEVVNEIESHTGIIVETKPREFEFSHKTLQEYLAAVYLIRSPLPKNLRHILKFNVAPLAVAISISSDAGVYFSNLILNSENFDNFDADTLRMLIDRVVIERPFFIERDDVGLSILAIIFAHGSDKKILENIKKLLELANVGKSVVNALGYYKSKTRNKQIKLVKIAEYMNQFGLEIPNKGKMSIEIYNKIFDYK